MESDRRAPASAFRPAKPKAIETLQFASGDESIRARLYDEFGDALIQNFESIEAAADARLSQWYGASADDNNEDISPGNRSLSEKKKRKLLDKKSWQRDAALVEVATFLRRTLGGQVFSDHNAFRDEVNATLKQAGHRLSVADRKVILRAVSWRDENAPPVIAKIYKSGTEDPAPLRGLYEIERKGEIAIVEYEPDSDLRDSETIPLKELGGIEAFIRREVLPHAPDAWIDDAKTAIGYEISFARYFYKPQPLRPLAEIRAEICALEKETEGLMTAILGAAQ